MSIFVDVGEANQKAIHKTEPLTMKIAALSALSLLSTASAFAPVSFGVSRQHSVQLDATRKPFITGNWKLNPQTREEAITLATDIAASVTDSTPDADIALFVPYVFIEAAKNAAGDKLMVGAEVSRVLRDVMAMLSLGDVIHQAVLSLHTFGRYASVCSMDLTTRIHNIHRVSARRLRVPLREQCLRPCFNPLALNGHLRDIPKGVCSLVKQMNTLMVNVSS